MKIVSNKIYNSKILDEFNFTLDHGEVFLSFHHYDQRVVGIYLKANEISEKRLLQIKEEAKVFFNEDFKHVELKLIGVQSAINQCTKVFLDNIFYKVKRVIRETHMEVVFIPSQNKVRVEKNVDNVIQFSSSRKTKILIVDDSKTIRTILNKIFSSDPLFEVIGMLERPSEVEPFINKNRPDVITLDIHMPEMDGVTLLKHIYPKYKIPCVMISSISLAEGPMVFDALEHGAVDYIQKPEAADIVPLTPVIIEKIRMAASVKTSSVNNQTSPTVSTKVTTKSAQDTLVVIGSSTGGTEALRKILTMLPDQIPPILIVQHIPAVFSLAFAKRMNDLCHFDVMEAKNGDEVKPNRVLIAPGGKQMKYVHKNGKSFVEINDDEPVNRFKPSVDYLFASVVKDFHCHTVAVILTGMGKDGSREMLKLKEKGAITIAQDEETCIVFGMPKEAINIGAIVHVEPVGNIAERLILATNQRANLKKAGNE